MSIELNHTIVQVKDRWAASRDVGRMLGLPEPRAYGPLAELSQVGGDVQLRAGNVDVEPGRLSQPLIAGGRHSQHHLSETDEVMHQQLLRSWST